MKNLCFWRKGLLSPSGKEKTEKAIILGGNVKNFSWLIVDLTDIYGRTLPGAIVLVDIYFIVNKFPIGVKFVSNIYEFSITLFIITFLLLSFLVGYMLLSLTYYFLRPIFRGSPREILSSDPTIDENVIKLFEQQFNKSALDENTGRVFDFCKLFILKKDPISYNILRALEVGRHTRNGLLFATLLTSPVFAMYRLFVMSALFLLFSGIFAWEFHRAFRREDREVLWTYYHAKTS